MVFNVVISFIAGLIVGFLVAPESIPKERVKTILKHVYVPEGERPAIIQNPELQDIRDAEIRDLLSDEEDPYDI